jgi:hypothetical protein
VVEAEQMQNTVNQELIKSGFCGHSSVLRFPGRRVQGNDDIAQKSRGDVAERPLLHGECHDIGGTGSIQVCLVQISNFLITYKEDRQFPVRRSQGV